MPRRLNDRRHFCQTMTDYIRLDITYFIFFDVPYHVMHTVYRRDRYYMLYNSILVDHYTINIYLMLYPIGKF